MVDTDNVVRAFHVFQQLDSAFCCVKCTPEFASFDRCGIHPSGDVLRCQSEYCDLGIAELPDHICRAEMFVPIIHVGSDAGNIYIFKVLFQCFHAMVKVVVSKIYIIISDLFHHN